MNTAVTYTLNDGGVYVDYTYQNAVDLSWERLALADDETCERVIGIAQDHGFQPEPYDAEWISEVADEATAWMNDHQAVDGAYWAFNGEVGGWGLFVEMNE